MLYDSIQLISVDYIKGYSPLMQNVDDQLILKAIFDAQNIDLRAVIGDDLFNSIITQYEDYKAAGGTSAPNPKNTYIEQRLLDLRAQFKMYLVNRVLYRSAYDLDSKLTNKGITHQSSDYSENIDFKLLTVRRKSWKDTSEDYISLVLKFIIANIDEYPEYSNIGCGSGGESPFQSALYLGEEL